MNTLPETGDWSGDERERMQAALAEGERVLWVGRPRVRLVHQRELPVAAFFLVLNVSLFLSEPLAAGLWSAAVIVFISAVLWNRHRLRLSCSMLTRRRAFSLRRTLWGRPKLFVWSLDKDFPGLADVDENGCGDIVFAELQHGDLVWKDGLHGISDVREVAALIGVDNLAPERDE